MSNNEEMMRPNGTLNGKKTSKGRDRTQVTETNQAEYDDVEAYLEKFEEQ